MNVQKLPSNGVQWVLVAALIAGIGSAWIAWVPLGGVPHVSDEIAYTLQARLFASGSRMGDAADNASMWLYPFWNNEGPMYSPFPMGWPLLLSLGERYGFSIWLNPLLCMLVPLVLFRIGRAVHSNPVGILAAFIGAASPGLWLMAGSRMAHTSVLVALGVLMVVVVEGAANRRRILLATTMAAYVILARPFDAVLLAGPLLVWGFVDAERKHRLLWPMLPTLATAWVLRDNLALTGDALRFPMSDWYDAWQTRQGCNQLGFGASVGCAKTLGSFGHTPGKALAIAWEAALRFDGLLLGVPGGGVLAVWMAIRSRARIGWLWVGLVVLGYALYWSPGRAYGARFWHPLYLVAPIALATGLVHLPRRWVLVGVGSLAIMGLSRISPDLSDSYWCTDSRIADLVQERDIQEGVLFVRSVGQRSQAWSSLGVEQFVCDPLLASGNAWMLAHPEKPVGGLQVRHALPDIEQTRMFMDLYHPGQPAWLVTQNLAENALTIRSLGTPTAR